MDEDDIKLPVKVDDLIQLLNKTFPLSNPVLGMSQDEIFYRAGQRSVVDWLIQVKNRDDTNTEE